jgi:hypothetical protein
LHTRSVQIGIQVSLSGEFTANGFLSLEFLSCVYLMRLLLCQFCVFRLHQNTPEIPRKLFSLQSNKINQNRARLASAYCRRAVSGKSVSSEQDSSQV